MTIRNQGFRAAHSGGGDWESIVEDCVEQLGGCAEATLGFVYVTDLLADSLDRVLARLKQATGIADWVGTIGFGVCVAGKEYFNTPAMAVLAASVPADSYRILPTVARPGAALPEDLRAWAAERRPVLGIVHGDPRNRYLPAIIDSLCDDTECFLVGGLTASRGAFPQVAGGDIVEGGLSGILLDRDIGVATGLSQGCAPDRRCARRDQGAGQRALRAQRPARARRVQGGYRRGAGAPTWSAWADTSTPPCRSPAAIPPITWCAT